MTTRLPRMLCAGAVAALCGMHAAHADIYTWVDGAGTITLSNLAPPKGVRVTNVVHESVPSDAAREAQVQALAARVRQLEDDVQRARQQPPMPPRVEYSAPPPPPIAYGFDAPPTPQYVVESAPPVYAGCDYTWMNCGAGWSGIYPVPVVIPRGRHFRHFHDPHPGHHSAFHPPMRTTAPRRR